MPYSQVLFFLGTNIMYQNLAILVGFIFIYGIVSGRLERTPISGAMVFIGFGLVFGPLCLGLLNLRVDAEVLRTLAELTLALLLFTEAANANLGVLKHSFRIPARLLLIGLPLTILLGFAFGVLLFETLTLLEIAILATMLAPTDAALGKAVVTKESVPVSIREGLKVESGLNDGICVPILFVFLALAESAGIEESTPALALKLVAEEIGIGAAVGVVLTFAGRWVLKQCADKGWVTETWRQVPIAMLAVGCFATAQRFGGSGFIACFVGGIVFDLIEKRHKHTLLVAAEGTGDTLALMTWVTFGAAVVGRRIHLLTWEIVLYSLLSLTVIRMLPVFLSLMKMNLGRREKFFIGWFGPRGLATVVFAVIVYNKNLPGGPTIVAIVICTVLLSVIAHGLSANPLVAALVASLKRSEAKTEPDERR
ncbi:MAG: cation:proton antiporter [Planctomycetota bacterium]|jgi:NhaP-type Na+/H+ or K+/H+ antiporter